MTNQATSPTNTISAKKSKLVPTLYVVGGVLAFLLISGLAIWGVMALASRFSLEIEVVRDLFIIALALESCVFGIVLIVMLIMLTRLVNTVEFEIKPVLQKTSETIGMVRGTTSFVSTNVVKPTISAASYIAGARRGVKSLFRASRGQLPD